MKKHNSNESDLTWQLFHENEISTNRITAIALLILGSLSFFLSILDWLDLYNLGNDTTVYIVFTGGIINIFAYFICRIFKFEKAWVKKVILHGALLSSGINFFLYPLNSNFITYGPIILSAMYYDQKLILRTSILSFVTFSFCLVANTFAEKYIPFMRELHAIEGLSLWKIPYYVFTDIFVPYSIVYVITTIICNGIARRGKNLVKKQAKITTQVASMEADLKAASTIQLNSLPPSYLETSNKEFEINSFIQPAKVVGGDFYDYFIKGDELVFLIGDVSDKGLPAAMFMMKAKYTIRAAIIEEKNLSDAIQRANAELCRDNPENMFVTLWIAVLNIKTGTGKYINCGHLYPIVRQKTGEAYHIKNSPNLMLGVFDDMKVQVHPLALKKGETLFLFTDGVTDAQKKGELQFGEQRLLGAIKELPSEANQCERIIEKIKEFSTGQEQFDDMTLITISRN